MRKTRKSDVLMNDRNLFLYLRNFLNLEYINFAIFIVILQIIIFIEIVLYEQKRFQVHYNLPYVTKKMKR